MAATVKTIITVRERDWRLMGASSCGWRAQSTAARHRTHLICRWFLPDHVTCCTGVGSPGGLSRFGPGWFAEGLLATKDVTIAAGLSNHAAINCRVNAKTA